MAQTKSTHRAADDPLAAELDAYNRAFSDLELPWRWDAETFRQLLAMAGATQEDCVGAYIERHQPLCTTTATGKGPGPVGTRKSPN